MPVNIGECIVTGDHEGAIRIWDVRTCGNVSSNTPATAFDNCISLPKGCISSFHENTDVISDRSDTHQSKRGDEYERIGILDMHDK